jgi:biuret amidohydrolase
LEGIHDGWRATPNEAVQRAAAARTKERRMQPPVDLQDREHFKAQMRELLTIDPASTAVITVDMQRDYLDPDVATAPLAAAEIDRVMGSTAKMLDLCRNIDIPVIHCYVSRRHAEAERGFYSGAYGKASREAKLRQNPQAGVRPTFDRVEGTPQAEVPASLVADSDLHMVTKRAMDSFHLSDLDMLLTRVFKPATLIIAGVNTDTCVHSTTFGASSRGYRPVVVSDCVGSMRGLDHHWMALELMSRTIAWVLTLDQLTEKLSASRTN